MFGRYFSQIDWSQLESFGTCEDKCTYFINVLSIGLAHIMPEIRDRVHNNDHPWINEKLRNLIKLRQQAFASGNLTLFKFYRNKVNRRRKIWRANYYTTKVNNLKQLNPKNWWHEVKRLSEMDNNVSLKSCIKKAVNQHLRPISLTCSYIVILMSFHTFSSSDYDNTMMQINTWKRNNCLTFYMQILIIPSSLMLFLFLS